VVLKSSFVARGRHVFFPLSSENSHIFLVFGYFTKWIFTSNVFNNLAGKFLNYLDPLKKYLPRTPHRKSTLARQRKINLSFVSGTHFQSLLPKHA
jgi:hypothetical protein